jgi:hypothetical protein
MKEVEGHRRRRRAWKILESILLKMAEALHRLL